jgi:hypothetical protein
MTKEANQYGWFRSAAIESALIYLFIGISAIALFEYQGNFWQLGFVVLVSYGSFIGFSALLGYFLGSWYVSEDGGFIIEAIFIPILVIGGAALGAGLLFGMASGLTEGGLSVSEIIETLSGGIWASVVFISITWWLLGLGAFVASAVIIRRHGRKPAL